MFGVIGDAVVIDDARVIHPRLRLWDLRWHHVYEDRLSDWTLEEIHEKPLRRWLRRALRAAEDELCA
eukprot:gene14401-1131_t